VENSYVQLNLGSGFSGRSDLGLDIGNGGSERTSQGLRPGFAGSALIGDSYTSGISIEAEGLYFTNNLDDAHSGATSNGGDAHAQGGGGFANLKYEHVNASPVFPYVAVGLGYGQVQYDVFNGTGASDGLMWQLKAGLAFPVSERFTWDVGYRFVRMQQYSTTSDVNIGGQNYIETFKSATQLLMLSAGARWSF
jgi:opacity protein-like surface antigen